jgi:ribosome recycling factor
VPRHRALSPHEEKAMSVADDVVKELHASIARTLESFRGELATVRTGRASLHMLDNVRVDYYGSATPLNQVATLSVPEPRMIVAKPWEKNLIPVIEKAIRDANLGFNPMSDKDMVRIPVPPLTEERRREIVKQVKHKGEEFKVSIRNERRDAKELLEVAEKDGDCSADEVKKSLEKVQKETDEGVKNVDLIVSAKEKDVMQV